MGFDKNSEGSPLVKPRRKTTKVNLGVAIAVIIFFAVAGAILWSIASNPEETRSDVRSKSENRN